MHHDVEELRGIHGQENRSGLHEGRVHGGGRGGQERCHAREHLLRRTGPRPDARLGCGVVPGDSLALVCQHEADDQQERAARERPHHVGAVVGLLPQLLGLLDDKAVRVPALGGDLRLLESLVEFLVQLLVRKHRSEPLQGLGGLATYRREEHNPRVNARVEEEASPQYNPRDHCRLREMLRVGATVHLSLSHQLEGLVREGASVEGQCAVAVAVVQQLRAPQREVDGERVARGPGGRGGRRGAEAGQAVEHRAGVLRRRQHRQRREVDHAAEDGEGVLEVLQDLGEGVLEEGQVGHAGVHCDVCQRPWDVVQVVQRERSGGRGRGPVADAAAEAGEGTLELL
mmetsp:Transcript_101346/g.264275  ORF Transcript_101346/g.264275 Transcript_101346/m.264275 type:complete len:343 (-) Transcript_101346:1256-2284(-)